MLPQQTSNQAIRAEPNSHEAELSATGARSARPVGPGLLLLSGWLALVVGLCDVAILIARVEIGQHGIYRKGRDFVWMAPLSLLVLFLACGFVLGLLASFRPGSGARFARYPLFTLAILGLLLTIPGLGAWAALTLAAGIAAWAVPYLEAKGDGFRRLVRTSAPVLLGLVVGMIAYSYAREPIAERLAATRQASAAPGAPNVILIVMDTVRADALSLHGYSRATSPNLERLASRGVKFDRAIAPASWTLPSHASMFTGRWPQELSAGLDSPLDSTYPTLAEYLSDHGYATAGIAANTFFCNHWYGLDRGFAHFEDYIVTPMELLRSSSLGYLLSKKLGQACDAISVATGRRIRQEFAADSSRKDAARINRDALRWLDRRNGRPFFLFLNYLDAHDPYIPPDGTRRHFGRVPRTPADDLLLRDWLGLDKSRVKPGDLALVRDSYDDCIASLDDQIGRLFAQLERRGLLENTLAIVTSDHGEHFGGHGCYGHRESVYQAVTHVPLLILGRDRVPAGAVVREPVSLRDLPATVVDLLGLERDAPFPGGSLARTWGPGPMAPRSPAFAIFDYRSGLPDSERRTAVTESGRLTGLVAEGKSYIRKGDGRQELYDLEADPGEIRNLADAEQERAILERLRRELEKTIANPEAGR